MIDLWLILVLLLLPLAVFVAWPLLRWRAGSPAGEAQVLSAQAVLFREHLAELEASRASGAVDDAQYQSMKAELARKLLAEEGEGYRLKERRNGGRGLLAGLALLIPLAAVGLYFYWGAHSDLALYREMLASQAGETDMVAEARITQQLRERATTHPEDISSRYVLAQRLMVSNDIDGAVTQYREILAREPGASNIRAELAQALFFAGGSQVTAEVAEQVARVLDAQPANPTALGLAGIAAFERREFEAARNYWQRALAQMQPGSNAAQALAAGVVRAENAMAEAGAGSAAPPGSERPAQSTPAQLADSAHSQIESAVAPEKTENSIRVMVSLAETVNASPQTPVFVYARTADSPMPLAIVRLTAADLPTEVVLDESRAMMPGRSLKTVDQVRLVARLAVGGNARPAPGDWQGQIEVLPRSDWTKPVNIAIDQQI
ncbi:c-type cytochrome biogenesis protein CcmI [Microbulbifer bruguierae]|uniref:C-type cytochrome biogenesis protein CcmI n=1 Tax=Microbulbifer bruguierae TaxID=3029061 RepID=A0ABY8NER7_9GAMM|nr:c-type cytochrome biogenesis protein CcmI [Microbulbifer bruguierae]WGL17416.1 c-type cytochrome biogenesis protein CcmI [Microbulbifer bruguierae]